MEETEVLIIGQGLAGTWLSWWLHRAGISFKIIDSPDPDSASRRAAGLINPVTGRRLVTTWLIDELMPFCLDAYRSIGDFLSETLIEKNRILDFFPTVQMLQAFEKRWMEDPAYLARGEDPQAYSEWFRYDLGWGAIDPAYLVRVEKLLGAWRKWLQTGHLLIPANFDRTELRLTANGVEYAGMHARYIIFCDGMASALSPYFKNLPFALNKGEALLVEVDGLPENLSFKKGMSLVPYQDRTFWFGSTYEWAYTRPDPTPEFRQQAEKGLTNFLKLPYRVLDHFASIRPATLERRPFVGFHPSDARVGILNGLGTKGCSLAPYFAYQLAQKIGGRGEIHPLADITRFANVLKRV